MGKHLSLTLLLPQGRILYHTYDLLTQNGRAILNSQDKGKSQGEIEE